MPRNNVQIGMGNTSLRAKIDYFFAGTGLGFNPDRMRRSRMREIIVLESASDAELAALGVQRDDIMRHVFRDILV